MQQGHVGPVNHCLLFDIGIWCQSLMCRCSKCHVTLAIIVCELLPGPPSAASCEDYDPGIWWLELKALALGLCSNSHWYQWYHDMALQTGQHLCRTVSLVKLWYHSWYLVKTRPWCWCTTLYSVLCTTCANTTCVVTCMIMKSQRFHSNLDRAVYFRPLIWSWWVLLAIKWNTNCAHTCAAHNMPC